MPVQTRASAPPRESTPPPGEETIIEPPREETPNPARDEPTDLANLPLEQLRERYELIQKMHGLFADMGMLPNKRTRSESLDASTANANAAKKVAIRMKPPTEAELYCTKDYAHFRAFISNQEATAAANGIDDEQQLAVAVAFLTPTLRELWKTALRGGQHLNDWDGLQAFLLGQLGDPANRKIEAWSRFLHARPKEGEDDFTYWHRWMEMKSEIGEDANDLDKVLLHLFFESFAPAIKREVRKQTKFPDTQQELISLLARLKPALQFQQQQYQRSQESRSQPTSSSRPKDLTANTS
jgi:hypothetical protein